MERLSVILIDVGWGDSILIESEDAAGDCRYGLVDCNDTSNLQSGHIFLRRHFEKKGIRVPEDRPVFDFVLLTHAHSDHGQGLKAQMKYFGTERFWYPKSLEWAGLSTLLDYANRSSRVGFHQSIDRTKHLPQLGPVQMNVLWPPHDEINEHNENNNSVVLALSLGDVSFVLTGDAEEEVWDHVATEIPGNTQFFKVPHHGSRNGSLRSDDTAAWLDDCPPDALLGLSSHIRPFKHPHQEVVDLFSTNNRTLYRTDRNYHLCFETHGVGSTICHYHH